jgi:hypothetical protein
MSRLEALLRRGVGRLRRSMTAQIGVSITLISVLLLVLGGAAVDRFLTGELTSENELTLFANLAFLRDDLAAGGYDLAGAPELVERLERRVNRLHAAVLDEQRHIIAQSAKFPVPAAALPQDVLDAGSLPPRRDEHAEEALPEGRAERACRLGCLRSSECTCVTGGVAER